MFGFNWIDGVIVLVLIGSILLTVKIGLLRQLFVIGGFFGTLFAAGWFFPHILPIRDRTLLTLVNVNLILITAMYAAVRSFDLADRLHWSLRKTKLRRLETGVGILTGLSAALILVWLLGVMIARLPFAGLSNSMSDARIVQLLTNRLPPVPAVFAAFSHQINPNSQPYLFVESRPQAGFDFSAADAQAAAAGTAASVVRLTGFGCGGLVSGSGFVAGPELVVTNAHVIAGVKRPIIKYSSRSYEGVPILFNSNLDFAVLRVKGLDAPPLTLAGQTVDPKTTVVVAGFPNGNYVAVPGLVRSQLSVFGRNIYDVGVVGRSVYEVQTRVSTGSSGGPLVLPDGRAVGMIFAQSDDLDDDAFALTSPSLLPGLKHVEKSTGRVSTGACVAD